MHPLFQLMHPGAEGELVAPGLRQHGPRSMNEQAPQIRITPLADPQQFRLASGRVLPWHPATGVLSANAEFKLIYVL